MEGGRVTKPVEPRVASYCIYDGPWGRIHQWSPDKWAIGWGPIRDITREEALKLMEKK